MFLDEIKNKKILIWGFGIEGISAFNLIKELTKDVIIAVSNEDEYKNKYNNLNFINENDILDHEFDYVIKSSGVSKYKNELNILKNRDVKITTIQNIFLSKVKEIKNNKNFPKIIGITGTKGKSTTSSMLNHILNSIGYKSVLVGNIGTSVLEIIDKIENYDYIVVEFSSYQCAMLEEYLDYSVVLNLFPEHIDWHMTHENYYKDKLNITNVSNISIINKSDLTISKFLNANNKNILYFNDKNGFYIENDLIMYKDNIIFDTKEIKTINGIHIFENLCSILTILKLENINIINSLESLKTFKTLEHRLEIFYTNTKNLICVDDSISTIPEATIRAIETFKNKDIYLILGGYDRKQDYSELVKYISNNNDIKSIYLTGDTGKRLLKLLDDIKYKNTYKYFDSLDDIVSSINFKNLENTVILLSPASASYDKYKSFKERGDLFKKLVSEKLK